MHPNTDFRWLGNMPIEVQLLIFDEFEGNLDELTLLALIQLSPHLAVVFCFDSNYLLRRIMQGRLCTGQKNQTCCQKYWAWLSGEVRFGISR